MMVSRGEIWLANLNPSKRSNEIGKVRPVLVLQNDSLNHIKYPTTVVAPMTTQLIDDSEPIRMRIKRREKLLADSDLILTNIRAIDNSRFIEMLATLSSEEMQKAKEFLDEILL